MKTCTLCQQPKPLDCFNKNARRKDGLQNVCRDCNRRVSGKYYESNTDKHRKVTKERRRVKRDEVVQKLNEIKEKSGCVRCGENDSACVDFHHLDPAQKDFMLSDASRYEWNWEEIEAEIKKCVCLCSNCHRKLHAKRFTL